MSNQQIRQSEIFAGEDWTVLYRAFTQINFNAYDPPSINAALRNYIQSNYPEEFNDWIESSEFVAIIDLLSWLAGSLAFRTDVNARENFLETAQARESVLRLARFLSYTPRRAQSARGLVKITELRTTQGIEDSFGVNLANRTIKWNDPDNPDWMEQFTIILNAAMSPTNPFGVPFKSERLGTAPTQLYRLNSTQNAPCVYKFSTNIDGRSQPFEIVNVDIQEGLGFFERDPNPSNGFHFVYRNDGRGNASERTGFFMMFKQGALNFQDFSITAPVENRVIDIESTNISETDIWTQTLLPDTGVQTYWTKVPALFSENITFNNINPSIRNIFSVVTRDNDRVALRFGDGRFSEVPVGDLRVWYRTVNGQQYQIRPRDMENQSITIPYTDTSGRQYLLTVKFSLQETVSNAVGPEDLEQIRRRAPQVYGAQNRMVSGEDYNVFPLSSNDVVKMRSVNRVYSGHSRFLDINDPTSTLQDTVVFSDDGALYKEKNITQYVQVPLSAGLTHEQMISRKIQPMLNSLSLREYAIDYFVSNNLGKIEPDINGVYPLTWVHLGGLGFSSEGKLTGIQSLNGDNSREFDAFFGEGCQIKFRTPANKFIWTTVLSAEIPGYDVACVLNDEVPTNSIAVMIVPAFRSKLEGRTLTHLNKSETEMISELLANKRSFKLWYVYGQKSAIKLTAGRNIEQLAGQWIAQDPNQLAPSETFREESTPVPVLTAQYIGGMFWTFTVNVGTRYVFESIRDVRWNNAHNHKVLDGTTGYSKRDQITLIDSGLKFDIVDNVYDPDGYPNYRKVVVSPTDSDDDGAVDNPEAFHDIVSTNSLVTFKHDLSSPYETLVPVFDLSTLTSAEQSAGLVTRQGIGEVRFQWKHYADTSVRIDPAVTNIIDIFVLTREYDYLVRQWIAGGGAVEDMPKAPTDIDLSIAFQEFEQYKMFSDQIVWRPVKYKFLFGDQAQPEVQAQFKIVKLPNSSLSDGEIRSKVIQSINDYFDVNKWEFGETFYFTELAAYIHLQLATSISSVVIVPLNNVGKFGELFEIRCASDEMFISTAQVKDVVIIDANTMSNLRIS